MMLNLLYVDVLYEEFVVNGLLFQDNRLIMGPFAIGMKSFKRTKEVCAPHANFTLRSTVRFVAEFGFQPAPNLSSNTKLPPTSHLFHVNFCSWPSA